MFGRPGTDWFFAALAVITLLFTIWKVPETKNRSLEEIEVEVTSKTREPAPQPA